MTNQKSKLEELATENVELQHHNRKLQEMLKGEQKVNSSTMDCIKKELEYSTQARVFHILISGSGIAACSCCHIT